MGNTSTQQGYSTTNITQHHVDTLPFTGFDVSLMLPIAVILLALGVTMRRFIKVPS